MRVRIITLTTDFGLRDAFVGCMKGVILGTNPRATMVDLVHDLRPGDVRGAAFALMSSCRFFPRGTIHVAVVDPGVGSERGALAVRTDRGVFIGPDNGVLSWALARERVRAIHRLERSAYFLREVSRTFHGRDVFAPVAAHLSKGLAPGRVGRKTADFVRLPWPDPERKTSHTRGEVVYVDRFGNVITNLPNEFLCSVGQLEVMARGVRVPVRKFYQAVPEGRAVAVEGSSGFVEIAVNGGSAERKLGLKLGSAIRLRMAGA